MEKFYTNYTWHAAQKFFSCCEWIKYLFDQSFTFLGHLLFSTKIDFHGSHNFQVLKKINFRVKTAPCLLQVCTCRQMSYAGGVNSPLIMQMKET